MKHEEDLAPDKDTLTLQGAVAVVLFIVLAFGFLAWLASAPTVNLSTHMMTEHIEGLP